MCSQTLESFVTTTPTPTESSTTLPPVSTTLAPQSTEPSHATTHALTTLPVYLTTTTLSNPSQTTTPSYTSTPTSTSTHIQTTTDSPTKDQIAFNRNSSTFIQKTNTIIEKESNVMGLLIATLSISVVSSIACVVFGVWSYKQHQNNKQQKMVRPSVANVELSPTQFAPMLKDEKKELRQSMRENRQRAAQLHRMEQGSMTSRPMMKRPSQVKKMTLEDWKRLRSELTPNTPAVIKKPPVKRNLKPTRAPPAPTNDIKPMAAVVNTKSYVQTMVKKLEKK
tara:strand:+ start:717 stop:1556 length:840 start_codon:yes stop_codon:yes gene_type:complete